MPMIDTAEIVAKRYGVSREAQDEYGAQSQARTAAAHQAGRFADEIVPVTATKNVVDKANGAKSAQQVTLDPEEGKRADTTTAALDGVQTARDGGGLTAGHTSNTSARPSPAPPRAGKE